MTPHRASLAVLPFNEAGHDAGHDYFCQGFVDDLITDLTRFSNLAVIASHSSGGTRANELATDFVVKGRLQREGGRLRVSALLIETVARNVIWSERFDQSAEDVFELQDEICARVVAAVSERIHVSLTAAAKRKPITDLRVYDFWLQGMDELKQGSLQADERARALFRKALECDPSYARAYVGLSLSHFNEWSCQLWQRWDDTERAAHDFAARALELDSSDHYAQLVLGRVLLYRREFDRAEYHLERAVALNENDADCLVQLALGVAYLGDSDRARALYERAIRLNPFHDAWYYAYGGIIAFAGDRFDEALTCHQRVPVDCMVDLSAHLAVCNLHLGRLGLAQDQVRHYLEQFRDKILNGRVSSPGEAIRWLQHTNPYRNPRDESRLIEGVRAVGLQTPEPSPLLAESPALCAFRQAGSVWQISFEGHDVCLPHVKGFTDLAALLGAPGRQFHCTELMGMVDRTDCGSQIDEQAKADYTTRIRELQAETADADSCNDAARAESLRAELDFLLEHLNAGLGLGGRSRKLGAPTERARSAVTQRIRAALKRIESAHRALGRHLACSVQTGASCTYLPERPVEWYL